MNKQMKTILVIAFVIAMALLCALIMPNVVKMPPWYLGGW